MKAKLALVSPFPPPYGGMSVLAETLNKCLANHDIEVITVNTHPNIRKTIKPIILNKLIQSIIFYLRLIKVIKADVIMIISSSDLYFHVKALPVLLLGKLLRKPVILDFVGGALEDKIKKNAFYWQKAFKAFDSVIVPTKTFQDLLINEGIQCVLIPHIVDISRFRVKATKPEKPVFLAIKHLSFYSGMDTLIQAFSEVKNKYHKATLYIAGEGSEKVALEKLVRELGLNGSVIFVGNVSYDRIPEIFEMASVFVHGTKYESFGIVLVEAFASGTPIVSTNIGGIPDLITDGENGFLVPFNDSQKTAEKMLQLIEDDLIYSNFKENGLKRSRAYSCDVIGPHFVKLIMSLCR